MLLVLRINLQEAVSESDAVTKRPVHVEFTKDRPSSASRYSLLGSLSVHDAYSRRPPQCCNAYSSSLQKQGGHTATSAGCDA